jgi:hypothetical protein
MFCGRGGGGGTDPFADSVCQPPRVLGIAAGGAQQCFEERGRSRIRIDPPGLVLEPHQHSDVADQQFASIPVDWQALLRLRIRQVEIASKMAPSAAACATPFETRLPEIRISVLPVAVRCATRKAINTSVQSTTIRAKPPSAPQTRRTQIVEKPLCGHPQRPLDKLARLPTPTDCVSKAHNVGALAGAGGSCRLNWPQRTLCYIYATDKAMP